jgi:hypothetical protein
MMQTMEQLPFVEEFLTEARQLHYDWVEHAFGTWLEAAKGKRRARLHRSLIAICDVQTWAILSRDLGLPSSEVRATLEMAVRSLLGAQE